MNEKFYPKLAEEGKKEIERAFEFLKAQIRDQCEEALGQIYVDIPCWIESDSWSNFRQQILNGLLDYNDAKVKFRYDFEKLRQKMYEEYREDIIDDLNKDHINKIEGLERENKRLKEELYKANCSY